MITFADGPALGEILELQRTPVMLRVVENRLTGEWDALDQLDDVADAAEAIHVYRLAGEVAHGHICCSPRRNSRWFTIAQYKYLGAVDDDHVRDNAAWTSWCEGNRAWLVTGGGPKE